MQGLSAHEADGEVHFTARHDLGTGHARPTDFRLLWFITVGERAGTPPRITTDTDAITATFTDDGSWAFTPKRGWRKIKR